jgi:flagellar biosynthesis protein FlhG
MSDCCQTGASGLHIFLEEDLGLDADQVKRLKERLRLLFPDARDTDTSFLPNLTPGKLKHAYMQQASKCHPKIVEGLSKNYRKARQKRYRQLFQDYKLLLPQIRSIHRKVQRIALQNGWDCIAGNASGKQIIAVGGAKGGVGKSALSANLAVGLALMGYRVVLADLDLGGADVHLYVGVKSLKRNWNDFIDKKVDTIEQIQTPTAFKGLTVLGGNASRLGNANLGYNQKLKIMRHLRTLESDFIIMDLGGDTSYNVLDFFLLADRKIVVTGTEPASILDTYSFIKVAFHRFLDRFFAKYESLQHMRLQLRKGLSFKAGEVTLDSIFEQVRAQNLTAYVDLKEQLEKYQVSLIVNMVESRKDLSYAKSMIQLIKDTCALDLEMLGTILFDTAVRRAARRFTPFVVEDPRSKSSRALHQVLSCIVLGQPKSVHAELFKKTRHIRNEIKNSIDQDDMQLDEQTSRQIQPVSEPVPKPITRFQKILGAIVT